MGITDRAPMVEPLEGGVVRARARIDRDVASGYDPAAFVEVLAR